MYRRISDFIVDWKLESENSLKILRSLTDESLSRRVTPEGRSLRTLAWHLIITLGEMGARAGLNIDCPPQNAPEPSTLAEIVEKYEKASSSVLQEVQDSWNDESLDETIDMYGMEWSRGMTLSALIRHEVHHRGQMTVLMRQAGLMVPGVYGPSKEEWALYNMPAMA